MARMPIAILVLAVIVSALAGEILWGDFVGPDHLVWGD